MFSHYFSRLPSENIRYQQHRHGSHQAERAESGRAMALEMLREALAIRRARLGVQHADTQAVVAQMERLTLGQPESKQ